MLKDITIGKSDYDWRAAIGVVMLIVAYLMGRLADLPEAWAPAIKLIDVTLGVIGVAFTAFGRPLVRTPPSVNRP